MATAIKLYWSTRCLINMSQFVSEWMNQWINRVSGHFHIVNSEWLWKPAKSYSYAYLSVRSSVRSVMHTTTHTSALVIRISQWTYLSPILIPLSTLCKIVSGITISLMFHDITTRTPLATLPAETMPWTDASLMLAHRLRRWTNIKPAFDQRLVFAGLGGGVTETEPSRGCTMQAKSWELSHRQPINFLGDRRWPNDDIITIWILTMYQRITLHFWELIS